MSVLKLIQGAFCIKNGKNHGFTQMSVECENHTWVLDREYSFPKNDVFSLWGKSFNHNLHIISMHYFSISRALSNLQQIWIKEFPSLPTQYISLTGKEFFLWNKKSWNRKCKNSYYPDLIIWPFLYIVILIVSLMALLLNELKPSWTKRSMKARQIKFPRLPVEIRFPPPRLPVPVVME